MEEVRKRGTARVGSLADLLLVTGRIGKLVFKCPCSPTSYRMHLYREETGLLLQVLIYHMTWE